MSRHSLLCPSLIRNETIPFQSNDVETWPLFSFGHPQFWSVRLMLSNWLSKSSILDKIIQSIRCEPESLLIDFVEFVLSSKWHPPAQRHPHWRTENPNDKLFSHHFYYVKYYGWLSLVRSDSFLSVNAIRQSSSHRRLFLASHLSCSLPAAFHSAFIAVINNMKLMY